MTSLLERFDALRKQVDGAIDSSVQEELVRRFVDEEFHIAERTEHARLSDEELAAGFHRLNALFDEREREERNQPKGGDARRV